MQAPSLGRSESKQLNGALSVYYNSTINFHDLTTTTIQILQERPPEGYDDKHGIVVTANGGSDVHVYGVKSDKGTGDGYLALPLTEKSTEFFIAAWM